MRDEGRPLEVGGQVQASNRSKLRSSRATVVSVAGKVGTRSRQVGSGEASESKPLMKCRNALDDVFSALVFAASLLINDRLAVGFTGHVDAAKYVFTALERRFGRQSRGPSLAELEATLRPLKLQLHSRKLARMVMGWTIRNRPCCFSWKTALGERLTLVDIGNRGIGQKEIYRVTVEFRFFGI